jgi:hypothetical protein
MQPPRILQLFPAPSFIAVFRALDPAAALAIPHVPVADLPHFFASEPNGSVFVHCSLDDARLSSPPPPPSN